MIEFQSIMISNFGCFTETVEVSFEEGLTLIQGVNNSDPSADSNGSGKSTIGEALSWCLFGKTTKGLVGDDVINDSVGKNCQVSVFFEHEGSRHVVKRTRKYKGNKLSFLRMGGSHIPTMEEDEDLTLGTTALTQERLNKFLGCDYNIFKQTVYAGQEDMVDLPAMTDKELKTAIEEAIGTTKLQDALLLVRRDKSRVESQILALSAAISGLKGELSLAEQKVALYEEQKQERTAEWERLKEDIAYETGSCNSQLAVIQGEIATMLAQNYETQREGLLQKIEDHAAEAVELSRLQLACGKADTDRQNALEVIKNQKSVIQDNKLSLNSLQDEIGTLCRECGTKITEEHLVTRKSVISDSLSSSELLLTQLESDYLELEKVAENANQSVLEHKSHITDLSATRLEIEQLNKAISQTENFQNREKALTDKLASLDKQLADPKNYEQIEKLEVEIVEKSKDCARIENDLAQQRLLLEKEETQLEIIKQAEQVFGPAGVRAHLLDQITPVLNQKTSDYLSVLSDNQITAEWTTLTRKADGEYSEKFSIKVIKQGVEGYKKLSGGEKRKVKLSCMLALQEICSTQAEKPINLMIMDEIDDALDTAGLERLLTILTDRSAGRSIMMISHNDIKSWISNVITVVNDGSKVTINE